jgi:hypothetical protein
MRWRWDCRHKSSAKCGTIYSVLGWWSMLASRSHCPIVRTTRFGFRLTPSSLPTRSNPYFTTYTKNTPQRSIFSVCDGGGIRTHEGRKPLPLFERGAFNQLSHSTMFNILINHINTNNHPKQNT